MANTKPLVAAACFCENVIEGKDGVFSAIRIVDTYIIPKIPEGIQVKGDLHGMIVVNGLIILKAGDVTGTGTVGLIMNKLDGERVNISPEGGWPVVLNGGSHGVNIRIQMPLGVKNFGLFWFDVTWDGEILTRIPLNIQQGDSLGQVEPDPS